MKTPIEQMVDRFLSWKLPDDFAPDAGITFEPPRHWPTGTNLLNAEQARAMLEYVAASVLSEAESNKDTERLDWLARRGENEDGADAAWWTGSMDRLVRFNLATSPCVYEGATLRAAIDEAMKEPPHEDSSR